MSPEASIGLVTLFVTAPPSLLLLWQCVRRRIHLNCKYCYLERRWYDVVTLIPSPARANLSHGDAGTWVSSPQSIADDGAESGSIRAILPYDGESPLAITIRITIKCSYSDMRTVFLLHYAAISQQTVLCAVKVLLLLWSVREHQTSTRVSTDLSLATLIWVLFLLISSSQLDH